MRKIFIALLLVIIFGTIILYSSLYPATELPNWIPTNLENTSPVLFSCDYSSGELLRIVARSEDKKWIWNNSTNSIDCVDVPYKEANINLTFIDLQELITPTIKWLKQEKYNVAQLDYCSPKYFWSEHSNGFSSINGVLVYSISKNTIKHMDGIVYTGNKDYGVISISTRQGVWQMIIDD